MHALRQKLLRDCWRARSQLGAIAVVMACGVALFVALRTMHGYLRTRQADYYDRFRFAELFGGLTRAPHTLLPRLAAIPGVAAVEARVVTQVVLDVPGLAEPATGWLVSIPDPPARPLNATALQGGRYPAPGRLGEVLASQAFARANGLRPGDSLGAILRGRRETLRIVGTAISPEFIYEIPAGGAAIFPDNRRFGVLWVPERGLAAALDLSGAFNDVAFALLPGAATAEVIPAVDRLLAPYGGRGLYPRKDQTSDQFITSEIEETEVTSILLPSVFLAVTAFLLHLVLSRLVATEREQIAVLKAFGYRNGSIARHYLGFALVPVAIGTLLGTALGVYLAAALSEVYDRFYQFPDAPFRPDVGVVLLAVGVSGSAALLGALGAVRRVVMLPPAEAMRPESPVSFKPLWLERASWWRRVPLAGRTILRSLRRRPGRALLSVTGLALAVALTVSGRFLFDSIEYLKRLQFFEIWRQDAAVSFEHRLPASVRGDLGRLPGVRQVELTRDVAVRFRHGAALERGALQGVEADGSLRRMIDAEGTVWPPPEGGILLAATLARRLGVRAGDRISVEVQDGGRDVLTLPVSGVIAELVGTSAYMRLADLHRALREAPAATGALLAVEPGQRAALNRRLKQLPAISGVSWLDTVLQGFEATIAESFRISLTTMILFAVVIAAGVVYNGARVSLAERGRELASLRVLGFSRSEVAVMLLGEQALLTLLAIPLGLAAGSGLCWLVVTRFTSDLFRIPLVISDATRLLAIGVVLVASVGSAMMVWGRIRRLDLIAVLKTRE